MRAYHFLNGHIGVEKLLKDIKLRYELQNPTRETLRNLHSESKKVVQYARPVTRQLGGERQHEMTPIPKAALISVCVNIFSLPELEWEESTYYAAVLCVDRRSGYMIAHPS